MRELRSKPLPCVVIDGMLFTKAQINKTKEKMVLFLQPENNLQKGKIIQLERNIKRRKNVIVSMERSYEGRIAAIYYPGTSRSINLSNFNEISNVVVMYYPLSQ